MAKHKTAHRSGKPAGMNYAQVLARQAAIRAGIERAARDATVQAEADAHTQRAMWLMVCSIRQASRSAVWGSTPAATSWRVKKQCFS